METRLIYGKNPVFEALEADHLIEVFAINSQDKVAKDLVKKIKAKNIPLKLVERHFLGNLAKTNDHQGFVAKANLIKNASLNYIYSQKNKGLRVLMLNLVQDPQNLGAVIRNTEHFGLDLLVIGQKGSCDIQFSSVAKASAGAIEHMPLVYSSRLEKVILELKEKNFLIYGLEADSKDLLSEAKFDSEQNICLVLGSEGFGLKDNLVQKLDNLFAIQTFGRVNSLNLSAASVVACMKLRGL